MASFYIDVHTHLTHDAFVEDWPAVIARAEAAGLGAIVVNGLEPRSNRQILAMAEKFPVIKAALGIYPIDAVNALLEPGTLSFEVKKFDVDAEIDFIAEKAQQKLLRAVGECGLDAYWLDEDYAPAQERVFRRLIEIAVANDLPIIVHSRKKEQRCRDILVEHGAKKVDMHCFGGKVKQAVKFAEEDGFWFSIPANAPRSESFRKMLATLPKDKLLTETDAPYLSARKGERTEPADVAGTVALLAELRGLAIEEARDLVWNNYRALFGR